LDHGFIKIVLFFIVFLWLKCGYGHLSAHRVWGRALKLLPTRVRAWVRVFFTNVGMGMGTIVPCPLGTHSHPQCTAMDQQSQFHEKLEEENGDDSEATKEIRNLSNIFNSDCVVWDLPADDLMNPMV